jgi:hypothetical protein
MGTGIEGDSQPTIEVIREARAGAAGIRFETTAYREQSSGKYAMHIGAGLEDRISSEELPFGAGLILRRESASATQESDQSEQHYRKKSTMSVRVR